MRTQIRKLYAIPLWLMSILLTVSNPAAAQHAGVPANDLFGRKYKPGETYRYKLTMEEWHNGTWDHTNISICELRVIKDSMGVPYDEVRWIYRRTINAKDTIYAIEAALSVKPYFISLDPKGKLDLPRIEIPEMTEPIQDFNTFFVAVSPALGTTKLNKKGDSILTKDPVIADFSNGSTILKGEDCIGFYVKMTGITKRQVMLHSSFFPPSQPCLSFLIPEMNIPVAADTINNFQMVMQTGPEQYIVQYGTEFFYINSSIRKSDGKIINATMFNQLNLKLKINCNKEYKNCPFEMPFSEQRNLRLELL
jgi:hypothetical protein